MPKRLQQTLARLVAEDTVSDRGNLAAAQWLADQLDALGFHTAIDPCVLPHGPAGGAQANLVAWVGPPEPGGLVLSGHLDVVPFEGQPGWTREPLRLSESAGRLYGRGTCDMKGFIAQILEAVRGYDPGRLRRPLVLILTCAEEIGCQGSARLVETLPGLLGDFPLPRLAWIGEPTSGRVFHTHKGIVVFEVRVRGEGGHSSRPEEGVNAIAVAARAVTAIGGVQEELRQQVRDAFRSVFPDGPYTSLNFGSIRGGTASNMIAEDCVFDVSYRPLPDEDPLAVYREIAERLAALDGRDFGSPGRSARIELGAPLVAPGLLSARATPLQAALSEALGEPGGGGAPFCTDGGHFAALGMHSLICGPGELDQAHQPDESIDAAALARGPDLLRRVIERLCAQNA